MKLEQGQMWKKGEEYFRIVRWARLAVDYKVLVSPSSKEGPVHKVTKKEFCRLIKGAVLAVPEPELPTVISSASR